MRIGDQWHLWYDAYDRNYRNDADCYSCYAQSKDGVHWQKPALGIYTYQGRKTNNILGFGTHGTTVSYDAHAPASERFKAIGVRFHAGQEWWVYGATSPDGRHWKWLDKPLLKKNADTANVCMCDNGSYRLFVRMWTGQTAFSGVRIVGYAESPVFGSFPDPKPILQPDKSDPSDFHLYNSATAKLRDDLYLMLPSGFFTKTGNLLICAAYSRDGKRFERLGRTPLLNLGKGFDSSGMYVGPGAIPGEKPNTYWFYYFGTATPHDKNEPKKVRHEGGVGRFLLEVVDR
jgi:hypothetical protein